MNNFKSPAPKDDSCHVWLKSDHAFSRRRWNSYFLQRAPPPTCYPPQGPIGATLGTAMNNFYSSPKKVSTHYITWLFSFWIWSRRCLKFAWFWPFGALPLGPHGGHTYYLNNFESPTPKDDSCQVWLKSNQAFSRRRWKCKKFTDDARRTKTDGNSSLGAKKLELCWLTCIICSSRWINGQDTKNNKTHEITMKLSMNFLFFVVYDNNYSI